MSPKPSRYAASVSASIGSRRSRSSRTRGSTSRCWPATCATISSSSTVVCASSSDVTCPMAPGGVRRCRTPGPPRRGPPPHRPGRPAGPRSPPAASGRVRGAARATMPRTHDVTDDGAPIFGSSTYTRSPVEATCASARKALALNAITSAGAAVCIAAETDQRRPAVGGDAEFAGDRVDVGGVLAGQPEQVLHPHGVRRRGGRQPRHDPGREHRAAAQHVLDVVGQRAPNPAAARSFRRSRAGGARRSPADGCRPPAAVAGPTPGARRRGRRHRWRATRRRCPTGRSTPGARAARRGRGWSFRRIVRRDRHLPHRRRRSARAWCVSRPFSLLMLWSARSAPV